MRRSIVLKLVPAMALCSAVWSAAACGGEGATTKPDQPTPASPLDDELFKDLSDAPPTKQAKPTRKPAPSATEPTPTETGAKNDRTKTGDAAPQTQPSRSAPAPKLTDPLDRELLNDLGGDGDAKPARKPGGGRGEGGAKPTGGQGGDGGDDEAAESDDPLVRLSRRVRDAERRLRSTDSGDRTQELQRGIVEDLEKLITQVEKQQAKQSKSQSKGPPSGERPGPKKPGAKKPGSESGDEPASNPNDSSEQLTAKKAEKPDAGKLKEMLEKVWGRLPERERQDVMQSSFEDFPAKYQFGIEQYFKQLLQRKD